MPGQVLTEVSAVVAPEQGPALLAAYLELIELPMPDGLLRTELLHGPEGHWRIQTLWRDHAALDAMRAGPTPPAAPRLFREVGAEPMLTVFDMAANYH
jgi:hypothetical protein